MLSQLTSFLWGSASAADLSQELAGNDSVHRELEGINDNDVMPPLPAGITDLNQLRLSPLSVTSVNTEEETDWVMVGISDRSSRPISVPVDSSNVDTSMSVSLRKDGETLMRRKNSQTAPQTRSGHHVYSAASVLNAINAVRPQQKALQRAHQEQFLKRHQLERNNKVQMVDSSSRKPLKRKNRYTPTLNSRACNNRKCQ